MTWLIVMEYLCHKWPLICSICCKYFTVLSSFMTYHWFCNYIYMTGAISGAGTAYTSDHLSSTPVFSGVCVTQSIVLCVCFVDRCLSFWRFSFFFWSLCCLFFNLWILYTPLVSSNSSYHLYPKTFFICQELFPI